jgi:hypothetical protein
MHGFDAILLPDGRKLVILLDAATLRCQTSKERSGQRGMASRD